MTNHPEKPLQSSLTKHTDRQVYRVGKIPADLVEAIRTAEPPVEAMAFDLETPEVLLAALEATEPGSVSDAVERDIGRAAVDELYALERAANTLEGSPPPKRGFKAD